MTELALADRVVTRWVRRPAPDVVNTLQASPPPTSLQFGTPFTSATDPTGRLIARAYGRVGRARVEVAVTAWPGDLSEITIRPSGRQLITWGDRRERRYFDLAHDAAAGMAAAVAA